MWSQTILGLPLPQAPGVMKRTMIPRAKIHPSHRRNQWDCRLSVLSKSHQRKLRLMHSQHHSNRRFRWKSWRGRAFRSHDGAAYQRRLQQGSGGLNAISMQSLKPSRNCALPTRTLCSFPTHYLVPRMLGMQDTLLVYPLVAILALLSPAHRRHPMHQFHLPLVLPEAPAPATPDVSTYTTPKDGQGSVYHRLGRLVRHPAGL